MKCGSSLRGTNGEFLRNPRRSQYGQQYRTVRMLFINVIRSPLLMSGSVFSSYSCRLGISLEKNRFCSVRHNAVFFRKQNHRGTYQYNRWVPLFYKAL